MSHRIIGISTFVYDPIGARTLYIDPGAFERLYKGSRRATRTKTLDGGAVVYDAGFAIADTSLTLTVKATSRTIGQYFARLVKTYNLIRVSTDGGVYSAVPASWREENGLATLEALVMEQIA